MTSLPAFLGAPVTIRVGAHHASGSQFRAPVPSGTRRDINGFVVEEQDRTEWCWAALTDGILRLYDHGPGGQCEVASRFIGRDCCRDRNENSPQDMEAVLNHFGLLNGSPTNGAVSEEAIVGDVDRDRPIAIQLDFYSRSHVVAVAGYARGYDDVFYLLLADPAYGGEPIATSAAPFAYEGANWGATFRTKNPSDGH